MSDSPRTQLQSALDNALAQYEETMGEAFPIAPELDVVEDTGFWALATMDNDVFVIRVSTGVVIVTAKLWNGAYVDTDFLNAVGGVIEATPVEIAHVSLVWLMLH